MICAGHPWLKIHDPLINLSNNMISFPSAYCNLHSFLQETVCTTVPDNSKIVVILKISVQGDPDAKSVTLNKYHAFSDVFSKKGYDSLP